MLENNGVKNTEKFKQWSFYIRLLSSRSEIAFWNVSTKFHNSAAYTRRAEVTSVRGTRPSARAPLKPYRPRGGWPEAGQLHGGRSRHLQATREGRGAGRPTAAAARFRRSQPALAWAASPVAFRLGNLPGRPAWRSAYLTADLSRPTDHSIGSDGERGCPSPARIAAPKQRAKTATAGQSRGLSRLGSSQLNCKTATVPLRTPPVLFRVVWFCCFSFRVGFLFCLSVAVVVLCFWFSSNAWLAFWSLFPLKMAETHRA